MPATLSMRTPSSVSAWKTKLPALLRVARSVLNEPASVVDGCLICCAEEDAGCDTPRSDLKPSMLLRMSMHYSLMPSSATPLITLVICAGSGRYCCVDLWLPVPLRDGYRIGKLAQ